MAISYTIIILNIAYLLTNAFAKEDEAKQSALVKVKDCKDNKTSLGSLLGGIWNYGTQVHMSDLSTISELKAAGFIVGNVTHSKLSANQFTVAQYNNPNQFWLNTGSEYIVKLNSGITIRVNELPNSDTANIVVGDNVYTARIDRTRVDKSRIDGLYLKEKAELAPHPYREKDNDTDLLLINNASSGYLPIAALSYNRVGMHFESPETLEPLAFRAASRDLSTLVLVNKKNEIEIWDKNSKKKICVFDPLKDEHSILWKVVLSPNANYIAIIDERRASSVAPDHDDRILIYDTHSGLLMRQFEVNNTTQGVLDIYFSVDSRKLISTHRDQKIRIWDIVTGKLVKTIDTNISKTVFDTQISPDGTEVACQEIQMPNEYNIYIYDLNNGTEVVKYKVKGSALKSESKYSRIYYIKSKNQFVHIEQNFANLKLYFVDSSGRLVDEFNVWGAEVVTTNGKYIAVYQAGKKKRIIFLTINEDGSISQKNIDLPVFTFHEGISTLNISDDGETVYGTLDTDLLSHFYVSTVTKEKMTGKPFIPKEYTSAFRRIKYRQYAHPYVVEALQNSVVVENIDGSSTYTLPIGETVSAVADNERYVAVGTVSGRINIYRGEKKLYELKSQSLETHDYSIQTIELYPDDVIVIKDSKDNIIVRNLNVYLELIEVSEVSAAELKENSDTKRTVEIKDNDTVIIKDKAGNVVGNFRATYEGKKSATMNTNYPFTVSIDYAAVYYQESSNKVFVATYEKSTSFLSVWIFEKNAWQRIAIEKVNHLTHAESLSYLPDNITNLSYLPNGDLLIHSGKKRYVLKFRKLTGLK